MITQPLMSAMAFSAVFSASAEDTFCDFTNDTGLEMNGQVFYCHTCKKLHLVLEIRRDRTEETRILQ